MSYMNVDAVCRIVLIAVYCLFSIIRLEYYRRTRITGQKTVIEERKRYSIWLSLFICYAVATFLVFLFFPQGLAWAAVALNFWLRIFGAIIALLALLWFIWIHRSLGNNLSTHLKIKDSQKLVTGGAYRRIRHPMYSAFFLLHFAVFFLTANWFIGLTWIVGITTIILLRIKREEAMLLAKFGGEYREYMNNTGRFVPLLKRKS